MSTQNGHSSPGDDHVALLVTLVLLTFGLFTASWAPLCVVSAMAILAWLTGRSVRVGYLSVMMTMISGVAAWESGEISLYVHNTVAIFIASVAGADWGSALITAWIRLPLRSSTWIVTSPLGFLASAFWLLLREDQKNSPEAQVFSSLERPKQAPLAKLRSYFTKRSMQLYVGAHILLASDMATGQKIFVTLDQLKRHIVVVGRSGRGKTQTILRLASEAARLGIPVLFLDGKGDPGVRLALDQIAGRFNRKFYSLDTTNPAESCFYDAFANKNATEKKELILQLREWSEPHFKGLSSAHALTTFKALDFAGVAADLHKFASHLQVNAMLALARRGAGRGRNYDAIKAEIVARRPNEKIAIESLASEVSSLTDTNFGELLNLQAAKSSNRRTLNLREARESSAIAYFGLPALVYPDAASKLASLIVGDMKQTLVTSDKQWLMILDEFSFFANPTTVLNLINMGRSFSASICLATQSCADFSATGSEDFLRQIFASVNTFAVHELTDATDSNTIAELFSTMAVVEYTSQIVEHRRTGSASSRSVRQFRIHPEWIKDLGVGEAYLLDKDHPKHISHVKIMRALNA